MNPKKICEKNGKLWDYQIILYEKQKKLYKLAKKMCKNKKEKIV